MGNPAPAFTPKRDGSYIWALAAGATAATRTVAARRPRKERMFMAPSR